LGLTVILGENHFLIEFDIGRFEVLDLMSELLYFFGGIGDYLIGLVEMGFELFDFGGIVFDDVVEFFGLIFELFNELF
jgi:hypothetical protein